MLDLGEIGLCGDSPLIRNLRAGFETPDAPFECGAIKPRSYLPPIIRN
jgi:hypothetical protein